MPAWSRSVSTERELLARVAAGLFRAPSVIKPNMLQPLRSSIYAFKTDFVVAAWIARLKPNEFAAAQRGARRVPATPIRRSAATTTSPSMRKALGQPLDVLMDVEPRTTETKGCPGRTYDQASGARRRCWRARWRR